MAHITTAQRAEIMRLLRKAEFDTRTITFQYRRLGVQENLMGTPVDAWLDRMDIAAGSALIQTLKGIV